MNEIYGRRLYSLPKELNSQVSQDGTVYGHNSGESHWAPKVHGICDSLSLRQKDRDSDKHAPCFYARVFSTYLQSVMLMIGFLIYS